MACSSHGTFPRHAPGAVEVTPVRGRADLKEFIDLPYRLHAGTPWIPPLKLERHAYLSRALNPFFKHGDAEFFLARRDGRVVGRISAQYDRNFNSFHGNRWGFFGFLEFEDDQEVARRAARGRRGLAASRSGRDRMIGPFDLIINEECGVLIEGFELEPMIRQPWHPPYYQAAVEAAGLVKAMDVFHWELGSTTATTRMLPILPRARRSARTTSTGSRSARCRSGAWAGT